MFDRTEILAPIIKRQLGIHDDRVLADTRQRLVNIVPGYPSPRAKVLISRRVRAEVAFMWPGLDIAVDLRDDSTISDLLQQVEDGSTTGSATDILSDFVALLVPASHVAW
jgi:hypothetical protein